MEEGLPKSPVSNNKVLNGKRKRSRTTGSGAYKRDERKWTLDEVMKELKNCLKFIFLRINEDHSDCLYIGYGAVVI